MSKFNHQLTNKERGIMEELLKTMRDLWQACEDNDNFNDWLSTQDIFSRSVDEIVVDVANNLHIELSGGSDDE